MSREELIAAAVRHVKDVSPGTYEEWVGAIIDFTCNACAKGPIPRLGEHTLDTPLLPLPSCVWPDTDEDA